MVEEMLSRRTVRHRLIRARNERIAADQRATAWPSTLYMSHETLTELLVDSDPAEQATLDFEGNRFLGIPITADDRLERGVVALQWSQGVTRG